MYDRAPVSAFELTPDGYVRRAGKVVHMAPLPDFGQQVDIRSLGSAADADTEAARRYLAIEQAPVQTGLPGQRL